MTTKRHRDGLAGGHSRAAGAERWDWYDDWRTDRREPEVVSIIATRHILPFAVFACHGTCHLIGVMLGGTRISWWQESTAEAIAMP